MPETNTESLKREIDTSRNEVLEIQEMEEFLKSEENIKKLGEAMNSNNSPELVQELENTLKDLCDKILSQAEISENQQKILDYFINKFGDKYPETKTKIENRSGKETDKGEDNDQKGESNNQEGESNDQKGGDNNQEGEDNGQEGEENEIINKDGEINLKSLEDEISSAVETLFNDPVHNLEYLGINKKTLFNWKNLLNDIKTVEDVEKINESTITKYLKISPDIPKENYAYIANNVKIIIKRHLEVNPKYQSILGGQSSHMTIETTVKNNEYLANLYNNVKSFIENPKNNKTVQIDNIVGKINKGDQNSLQFVNLWLNMYLGDKKGTEQNKIVEKIFDKFPSTNPENFLNACNNDEALGNLKDSYIQYRLQKENVLFGTKDENGADAFILDMTKKNKFEKFKGKGGKITKEYDFDKAYKYTQDFYVGLKGLRIDESIPLNNIINFLIFRSTKQEENTNLSKIASEKIRKDRDMVDNNPFLGYGGHVTANNAGFNEEKKIKNNCITIEEKYAALLLKSKNRPKGKIQGISGSNLTLDFSKGNNPKDIVRDNLGEKLSDSWHEFKYNISYDRKAAVGGAAGMIAGILASGASCVSGNIWAAAGAFTLASRGVNGAAQEALNGIQYAVESISGEKATGGNQVNNLGDSFMKGIGAYEPVVDKDGQPILDENGKIQYQFIGWDRFTSNLAFDYLGGVAMFGAFKALGPSFEAIKSVKIAGKPLEFASKWLFVQNFGIDMPMNALHKGTDVFLGIGDKQQKYHGSFLYGHNNGGEDAEGNEYYKSGNIGDAFEAMLGNMEEHISFNNQSQVLFNTLLYCGMLEAGQGLASKMKSYMPVSRIEKYETSSRKFQKAQRDFVSEISKKGLKLNEKFELVNAKTGKKIGALEFLEFKLPLLKLKGVLAEHTKATQELVASEKELSGDGSKTYKLLKEMGLLSDKQPPLNILKERINKAKKQYQEAIEAGDIKKAQDLKEIILDHQSAQITLISEFHPDAINNINLSSEERIQKAKELLQSELTAEQEQAILDAHNTPGDAYSLSIPELRAKSKILFKAGFTEAQVRTLIENCICGKMKGVKGGEDVAKKEEGVKEEGLKEEGLKEVTGNKLIEPIKVKGGKENTLEDIKTIKENLNNQLDNMDESKCSKKIKEIIKEKMDVLEKEIAGKEIAEIDFDPENGTFRAFGGFEKFMENLIGRKNLEKNFLNNIKLTIDYMTKKIINVGEAEPITLKERESRMNVGENFMKAMEEHMINQWLDNPQYFNSHGFDHTILVHSLIVKVRNGLKECADTVAEKYKLSGEKADKLYNSLIELSAALHDLGYPAQSKNKWEKTTHATSGAELFYKELKPKFEEFVTKEIGLDAEVAGDLACDMYNAVCFHGADKVESHYVSRVEGMDNEGRLYGGTLVPRKGAITGENIRGNLDFQSFRISYKSEGFREGAPGRYAGVRNDKLEVFESVDGKTRKIVEREGDKGKVKPLKDPEDISTNAVRSSVQERQNLSRTTAFSQAIELSKTWGSDIKIYVEGECFEFVRVTEKITEKVEDKEVVKDVVRFKGKDGKVLDIYAEDFIKENDILKIEGRGKNGENNKIELNVENLGKINEQAIDQALGWLCDLEIKTDKGTITYSKESGKYESAGKEITKEELLNGYKINEITVKVKGETGEIANGRTITVNDNAYEGRFLNNDGTGLEYRSQDLKKDPLMSMIRIADNLDMAFNRLIPSQSNAIFLTTLYNLENKGEIANLFQKMEKFNDGKKGKLKDEEPPTEQEIRDLFSKELNIDIYKIFEEKGCETNEGWDSDGKKQVKNKFNFEDYFIEGSGTFDLGKFKQDLFDMIRFSEPPIIKSGFGEEILDMSHDLMNEGKVGSYSVRHMVGLRPIENVDFNVDGSVEIKIDMDLYFKSDLSNRIVEEDGHNIRLVEYHLWREGTALKAVPLNGQRIKSYVVDKNGKRIGEIDENGVIDYRAMFENGDKLKNDDGSIDYSKGIIKEEYKEYKNSPIFKNRTGKGKKKAQKN